MNNEYNLSILEALFTDHLSAGNISRVSVKNYRSDIKHFLSWFYVYIRPYIDSLDSSETSVSHIDVFIMHSTNGLIEAFKEYLLISNIPTKTINRRLSAIRKFYQFCVLRGYLSHNPSVGVANVRIVPEVSANSKSLNDILPKDEFEKYLSSNLNIDNQAQILNDYEEFKNLWE